MKRQVTIDTTKISLLVIGLLLGLAVGIFQPFIGSDTTKRTVDVTGSATLSAEPDEFVFQPTYEAQNAERQAALDAANQKGSAIIAGLTDLGVPESGLKTDVTVYEDFQPCLEDCSTPAGFIGSFSVTIRTTEKALSESISNYLSTQDLIGSITPVSSFSEEKTKTLNAEARTKAVEEARSQAQQIADELGLKVGQVVNIEEVAGFDQAFQPFALDSAIVTSELAEEVPILTGEQNLSFTVKASFELN